MSRCAVSIVDFRRSFERSGVGERVGAVLTLAQVAEATGGELLGAPGVHIASITTDSRAQVEGALFVALVGDRFDGHDFVASTLHRGAAAALVSDVESLPSEPERRLAVLVPDTLRALQDLAAWHRKRVDATVVGLTGSVGKTTTKELVASILSGVGPTLKTVGNLNNHIGVPLTLLRLERSHRFAVIEMGCSGFGEIARLAEIARPTVGLITAVAEAHLEGLGDLEGVARAKGELFDALPADGTAVVNLDDARVRARPSPASRRLGYGRSADAEVRLVDRVLLKDGTQQLTIDIAGAGRIEPSLRLLGEHNAANAVAAAAMAVALGIGADTIIDGLGAARPAPGRLELRRSNAGHVVIDDSYNANPSSVKAALSMLVEHVRGHGVRAHALLGEMCELGPDGPSQHVRIGQCAASLGLETLVAAGQAAEGYAQGALAAGMRADQIASVDTPEHAASVVLERAREGDVILVKGSRAAAMERAVAALCDGGEEGGRQGAP